MFDKILLLLSNLLYMFLSLVLWKILAKIMNIRSI